MSHVSGQNSSVIGTLLFSAWAGATRETYVASNARRPGNKALLVQSDTDILSGD